MCACVHVSVYGVRRRTPYFNDFCARIVFLSIAIYFFCSVFDVFGFPNLHEQSHDFSSAYYVCWELSQIRISIKSNSDLHLNSMSFLYARQRTELINPNLKAKHNTLTPFWRHFNVSHHYRSFVFYLFFTHSFAICKTIHVHYSHI